jgi:MFS family permease
MAFVAISEIFPRRYTARAIAMVSTFWGVSAFLGPLIGGVFVEYATWRWGFGFFALQAFGLSAWIALRPEKSAPATSASGAFPLRRLALLCLAVLMVSSGGVEIKPLQTTLLVVAGLLCLNLFLRLDGRAGNDRLLPHHPFGLGTPTGAALLMILSLSIATIALTAFGPLLVTAVHGVSALIAGYIIACSSIGWTIAAVLVSGSPERLDRQLIAAGITLVVLSIAGFVYAVPNGPVWLVAVFAAMEGAGFGLAWTFILRRTTSLTEPSETQRISGAMPTVQRLGYALGAAYVGIVANASGFISMDSARVAAEVAKWIFLACLPFGVLALVAMLALVRNQPISTKVEPG